MQLTTMRRIDVHCHPNTVEWFNAINPYVEALRTYWHRPWAPLSEQQVIDELRAA
ncbi:MAG: amidohydrolase, partial [Chloroflexi bacterium]